MRILTIADRLLIVSLAVLTLFSYSIAANGRVGKEIRIEADGKAVGVYPLSKDGIYEAKGVLGTSRIAVSGGKASFLSSPCRNKVCIHQGRIGRSGQTAVCLPNRVVATITGEKNDYDAVTR